MKKRIGLIFAVLLFSVLGFSACGDPYKKMSFSLTSEKDLTETVELYLGKSSAGLSEYDIKDSFVIKAKVGGVGKKISTDVVVPDFNDKVDIETTETENSTIIKITAKSEGETMLTISPKENPDGKFTKYVRVKVSIGLTSFVFKPNAIGALAVGDTLNLNVDAKQYINFFPSDTSQTDIEYSIRYPEGASTDYAEIKNGVLYAYDSENYPMSDGRRIITLEAKCPTRDDLVDTFDIPVIKIDNQINISTTYEDNEIVLDKNYNGKYEIILANADISMSGGVIDENITNRILHIGLGDENTATSKYRISVVGDYSMSAGEAVTISPYLILESDTADFIVKANRVTNGMDVVFKIEYFGDENDNPTSDETLYQGLFTQYVTFTIKVYSLPDAKNMTINGIADDGQTYVVYDTYFKASESNINENGTLFKVKLIDSTIPNIVANISYSGEGFDQNGLVFVGGTKTADGISILNGESFYLKHTYSQAQIKEDAERRPYITISIDYSFAPSNATAEQKEMYYSGTISKKVYLDFKAGISEISLPSEQIGLEITSDEWRELYAFPEGYDASATVDQILGRNLGLIELDYVDNKIMIRANQQFKTGEVSLRIIATNGKSSNTASIMVYLPVLYTENNSLLVKIDEKDNAVFAVGKITGENEYEVTGATTCYYETYSYSTYQNLILASHSTLALDVYSIMEEDGYLKSVMPNVNVTCEISDNNILSWTTTKSSDGVLSGTLNTFNALDGVVTITFTLSGYSPQGEDKNLTSVTRTHTINIWVYDAITKIDFSKKLNTIYLNNSLGYYDQGDSEYIYDWAQLPSDGVVGNFEWDITLKNSNQLSHSISLDRLGNNVINVLIKKVFGDTCNAGDYDIKIVDSNGENRLRKDENNNYILDIYNSDLLTQVLDDDNNIGYEAKITEERFTIKITEENTAELSLIEIFEKMFEDKSNKQKSELALAYIFNGNISSNFRDFVISGQAKQFGRSMYVETILRVYKPVKVVSIDVSVSNEGLYFEREAGTELASQSFTYNVLPNNAHNTDIMLKIYRGGVEQNIVVTTTEYFTLSADKMVVVGGTQYKFINDKLYAYNEDSQEYDAEKNIKCGLLNSTTIWVDVEENSHSGDTVASATINNGKITIKIASGISGDYVLKLIAKDSVTQNGESGFKYGVTKDVRVEIGDGSKEAPFQLRSIDSLIRMWSRNIGGQETFCYKLNNNINVIGQNFAEYIFNDKNLFRGDFDGNGKAIIGLTAKQSINGNATGGLFAKYEPNSGNSIHDLTLSNINYNITINTNNAYTLNVGGIAGSTKGTIENVYVSGNINIDYADEINENKDSVMYVGGIIGTMAGGTLKGTAESSSFADDMTANVAIIYNGFVWSETQGSHYFGGAIGCVSGAATIENIKVSSSIKAINNSDSNGNTIANATLGGVVGLVSDESSIKVKDSRITPTLSGYANIGGVVGESTSTLDINHVVVEFLHNTNVKNYIMGLNNVGGFVGNATAKVSLTNSYVRSFVKDEVADKYKAGDYCGNIIVKSGLKENEVNAGGFIGYADADIDIERSYVMGDIKSYVGSDKTENIGGFVGGYDSTKTIKITDAYYYGRILTNNVVPNIIFGSDSTPTPIAGSSSEKNITSKITENTMTDDKNIGEYIKIEATKTESVSYQDYTYSYGENITISNFYANVNGSNHVWTGKGQNAYTLRTPRNVVKSTMYMTFARMTDASIVYTGYKIVEDSNNGTKKRYNLFEIQDETWFSQEENQTNYVDIDKANVFKTLGFDGQNANMPTLAGSPEKFVLNANSFNNPTNVELITLLCSASGETKENEAINALIEQCRYNEQEEKGTFNIEDISEIEIGDLYAYEYDVENERNVFAWEFDNEEYKSYYTIDSDTNIGTIILNEVGLTLYLSGDDLYINKDCTIEFVNVIIIITTRSGDDYETSYVALGKNESGTYVGTDNKTYYHNSEDDLYYSDENYQTSVESKNVTDIQFADYTICDLVYKVGDSEISKYSNIVKNGDVITFEGKEYSIVAGKVKLVANTELIVKANGFKYTNGNVAKDETDNYRLNESYYVIDTDGNIVAKYIDGKFVSDTQNASWILSDDVNNGMPALIRKLGADEKTDSLDILYDTVASINVKVTEFNYDGSSNLTPYKQGYIMLDESNVILFYNTPSDKYIAQNTYVLASSDEKAELDSISIGGQVPVVVDFSDVSLNAPFKLTSVKDYSIKSDNPNILSVGKYDSYTALNTLGTGIVTLTFTNKYDDANSFKISVYVVAGLTGVKYTESMSTYVQKTNTYSFGFDNILTTDEESYNMDANVGGYTIKVVSVDDDCDPSLIFNGVTLDKDTTDEYEFDMSNPIVIYGEKAGTINISLTPFVKYGDNQKYTLSYLNRRISITINDLAKSISTGSNTATTIKPESTVQFNVEVISSNSNEEITTYITDRDGKKDKYDTDSGETYGLVDIYVLPTNTTALENNLYKVTYTVYAELNDDEYYTYYIENNFKNPLEEMLSFEFEFVPNSWFVNENESEIMTEFENKTAKYLVNIEGNAVSSIITSFYNTADADNDNKNKVEEEKIYIIDSNAAYVNKLAPGRVGLLRIKVSKDYNNLSYLAVRTSNNSVTLRQANATTDATQEFSHINIANTPTDNGIKLWNMMYYYYTKDSEGNNKKAIDMNYANYYYVFVMFDEKITGGSVVDLQITAYGKGDVELIPSVTVSIDVDYLPQIEIVDAYGESNVDNPIGEYRRIYINASHVENNLSWSVAPKSDSKMYGFSNNPVGETTVYGYNQVSSPDSNYYPYICYKNAGVYEQLPYNFTLDMISGAELYIYIPANTYLGDFEFSVSGYRIINTKPTYTIGKFALTTILFEIEDITIDGATGGVITLPVGNYTTFSTIFTLNSYAQSLYNSYNPEGENDAFVEYLYDTVENLRKSGAGQTTYNDIEPGYNGWSHVPDKGETSQMQNGDNYPSSENSNFVFFYENFEGIGKYGVTALKISRNTIQYKLDIKLENGIYALDLSTEPEIYKEVTFTLQITDNSTADHPIPIYNTTDFIQMLESISEEQVNQEVSNNSDVDPTELVFGNYILLSDLTLEDWIPRSINVSSFDGNGFTITIKSWNFSSIIEDSTVSAGLFTKIGEYTVVKNLNIDISQLLSSDTTKESAKTKFEDASGDAIQEVTFGVVAAENAGVLSNIKVVATDNTKGNYLNVWTQQGYSNGELCSATISGFVATNSGAISDCFVGLNAVDIGKDGYSYIPTTTTKNTNSNTNSSTNTKVYPFTLVGGNKLSGFVHQNSGTISNSYVMGVSIKNQTEKIDGSMTAGFVNQNANNGSIYSCFVSGSEYSGYESDIVDLRATKTHIYSKGNVGGFVYENQGNIENAYSIINIKVQAGMSGGFAYTNSTNGMIKNAYSTSINSNIDSYTHGMFVYSNTATLQNAYYLIIEGEMGITSTNKSDDVLKALDPANAIVSSKPSESSDNNTVAFANAGSFEGFTFASGTNTYDGIWYYNGKYYPQLVNTINYNIKSVRTLTNTESTDNSSGSTAGSNLKYNYTYKGNPNIGSEQNPIVISQPAQFAQYIVANTIKVGDIYVFGGEKVETTTYAPAYIRIINNISLSKINLSNTYSYNGTGGEKISLSKVIFDGYLIGNGMTISDITLNNTSTSGNNLEDFGLFKQIGLSETQKETYYSGKTIITNPVVYNIKFSYNELSDRDANKVGLLAGSIYDEAAIMNVTIEGKKDAVDNTVSTITGHNLVGAVAGLIQGNVTLTDITIKNVRVNATRNTIDSLSDSYNDSGSYYESFEFGQNKTAYKKIEFNNNTISNLSQISYAGGVAGVIIANNLSTENGKTVISDLSDMSTYTLSEYQNVSVGIHDIVVKDNVEISGDMAGGLFGYAKNTHVRSSSFLLMQGANSTDSYQRIFGRAFGGGLIGQTDGVVLERTNIYHADQEYQNTIDTTIAQITSDSVSKNDLFLKGDIATTESVSVAIGGMVGLSKDMIVLDSYSKVNVYNPKSKIAGGVIGYAEGKNGISYSFTYGNVKAKEVIGGLIGFYRYNSFDLYLNNAFALNVWSSDVQNTLKTNLTAVYGSRYDYTLRMPEIGNQMSEYSDGSIKLTGKTNSVVSDGNSTFTYIGSVLGKATLNNGVYKSYSGDTILTIVDGKLGGTAVKNLFVCGDGDRNVTIINSEKTAVRLFTSTTTDNNDYVITDNDNDIMTVEVEKVVYNTVGTGVDDESDKEYYTYIGDQFHNVYSSLYGVTTRTGSATENNLMSEFNGLTPNNETVVESTPTNNGYFTGTNNAIQYSTIFGTQYAISQITGYFQASGNAGGIEYINLFNAPTFTHVFSKSDVDGFVYNNLINDVNRKLGNDYVSAANSKATSENLSSWYFDESTGLLRYRVGSDGSVTEITTHEQLINVLESNTKGKSYTLNIADGDKGSEIGGADTSTRFTERFRGSITGATDENKTIRQVVNIKLSQPVFATLEGAYLANIEFHIDLSGWTGTMDAANYNDGSWGVFAQYIDRTTFENCSFVLKNVNGTINTFADNGSTNTKYAGLLFGRMLNSTLTNCEFRIEETSSNITIQNTTSGFGAIAGMMSGGSISNMKVNFSKSINVINGGFVDGGFTSESTVGFETNVGSLIGVVSGASISGINDETNSSQIKVTGTVRDGDSTIGGLFGSVSGGSSISNCNYYNNMDVNVVVVSNDKSSSMSIGGVIGKLTSGTISNCYFNGSMDANGNYTDSSAGKLFNVTLTNNSPRSKIVSDYIGGVVGQINSYINNSNNVMINRVPINVTINADGSTAIDDNIYVGGIFGADTDSNSGSKHSSMFVTGDITVKTNETYDNLYVGGVIGKSSSGGIENSYMQGDITVDGAKNNRVGGIVGAISKAAGFEKCVMYGDIRYTLNTSSSTTYYLAGIVGGRISASIGDSSTYEFKYCTVLASIYEVEWNSNKYDMVTGDSTGNKYSSTKYTGLYISPFISGINVDNVTLDSTDFYIIEDYFDFYYEKESESVVPVGVYYYNVCDELIKLAENTSLSGKLENNSIIMDWGDGNATYYAFVNHYFFHKNYDEGTKYNPYILDSISDTISGYNVITTNTINLASDLTINRNAVLAGNTTAGITFTGGKTVTNNGVIENIVFNWDGAIGANNGILNNVVAYKENADTPSSDTTLYGLVDTNNGYIYRSGAIVVYTGLTESSSAIQIGGLVYENTNTIGLSYCSSMLTGLKYDENGIAYVIGSGENKTTTKLSITSGGIAYTNSGIIEDSLFNGTLYGGNQDLYNIANTNTGKIQDTYSDKNSMYYSGEQEVNNVNITPDTRFYTANSDYTKNFGRPYVTGGITINTKISYNNGNSTITYFETSMTTNKVYPVFNINDFNNIAGENNTASSNDYVLLNDLYVGYTKDVYDTQNLTGTFYGKGYSIVSSYDGAKANVTHSTPLFKGSPNIDYLYVRNFSTTANAILGSNLGGTTQKTLDNVFFEDCKVEYSGTETYVGVAVGKLSNYETNWVTIENTMLDITAKYQKYYGIFGYVKNSTIENGDNRTSQFTISGINTCYGGGIAGGIENTTINGSVVISSASNSNVGYFGGIVGTCVSGINIFNNNTVTGTLKGNIVGGHIAFIGDTTYNNNKSISVELKDIKSGTDEANLIIEATDKAGGVFGDVVGTMKNIKNYNEILFECKIITDGLKIENTTIKTTNAESSAGGVFGMIAWSPNSNQITIKNSEIAAYVASEKGYAGGIAGYISMLGDEYPEEMCITYESDNDLDLNVELSIAKSSGSDDSVTYYTAEKWSEKIKNNGWGTATRFGSINKDYAANEYFGYENGVPAGYSMQYQDEDITDNRGNWQAPSDRDNVSKIQKEWKNGTFQPHKGGQDDSRYYSNMTKDDYFDSATIDDDCFIQVNSGILYGYINNSRSILLKYDIVNNDTANINIDDSNLIYIDKGSVNNNRYYSEKYLLYRHTQWIYTSVETGSYNNSGLLAIEYDLYVSNKDLVGEYYGKISDVTCSEKYDSVGNETIKAKRTKQHIDVYVSCHIDITTDAFFYNDGSSYHWAMSVVYKINEEYAGFKGLYSSNGCDIITNFYWSLKFSRYSTTNYIYTMLNNKDYAQRQYVNKDKDWKFGYQLYNYYESL